MEIKDFIKELNQIDKNKVSKEIFNWIIKSKDSYIDTHKTTYMINFMADPVNMPETLKIEQLATTLSKIEIKAGEEESFKDAIESNEEVEEESVKQEALNNYLNEVCEIMSSDSDSLEKLFKELSFYYEMVGFSKDGKPITKELDGYVNVLYLSFENVDMELSRTPLIPVLDSDGRVVSYEKKESEREIIANLPPNFAFDMEISFWEKKYESSLF